MCRLLCYMGAPIPMELLITKPEHSLVSQSRDASYHPGCPDKRNIRVNADGFGIAWYNAKKVEEGACLVKFATPAWSSCNLLNIAKFVESGLVFAHVRAASDGSVLTGNINYENTHPFKLKRYTFMHNGGITGFPQMKRDLLSQLGDEAYEAMEGTTDSEVCFAFFLDELPDTDAQLTAQEIAQALRRAIARIVSAVARFHRPLARAPSRKNANDPLAPTAAEAMAPAVLNSNAHYGGISTASTGQVGEEQPETAAVHLPRRKEQQEVVPPMSLNFCVTDGRHIVCSRYRNHPRQEPPSLFFMAGAGFACDKEGSCLRLTAAEPLSSVVISSEPLCRSTKAWELLPRNSMVIVEGHAPEFASPTVSAATGCMGTHEGSCGGHDHGAKAGVVAEQGLVSSITVEPLRCHPSDEPGPTDPGFECAGLPNWCPRVMTPPPRETGAGGEPVGSPESSVPPIVLAKSSSVNVVASKTRAMPPSAAVGGTGGGRLPQQDSVQVNGNSE